MSDYPQGLVRRLQIQLAQPPGQWSERTGEHTWREVPEGSPYLLTYRSDVAALVDLVELMTDVAEAAREVADLAPTLRAFIDDPLFHQACTVLHGRLEALGTSDKGGNK